MWPQSTRTQKHSWVHIGKITRLVLRLEYTCILKHKLPSNFSYKSHISRKSTCLSLRCSWSIACQHCSNYISIPHLTYGFNGLGKDNCKTTRETFKFWDLLCLMLEVSLYVLWPPLSTFCEQHFYKPFTSSWMYYVLVLCMSLFPTIQDEHITK